MKNRIGKYSNNACPSEKSFESGFTLVELMVVIAIIALLAGVLLVNMMGYGKDARDSKAMALISGVIPSMVSCWGNGGTPLGPGLKGGSAMPICNLNNSFGSWPAMAGDLSNYEYRAGFNSSSDWAFFVSVTPGTCPCICCNGTIKSCKIADACSGAYPAN